MRTLVLPRTVVRDICRIVGEGPQGCETGVALFGARVSRHVSSLSYANKSWPTLVHDDYVVLAVVGPGPRATHQSAHYSGDADYASAIYQALRRALPSIVWLGELHVHPRGMTWLSGGDRRTVRELLSSTAADTVSPTEFIAGVMQRRKHTVEIYPYYFSRRLLDGVRVEIERVPHDAAILRQARELAMQNATSLSEAERPDTAERRGEERPCQGWFARTVNTFRRKTQ